MNHSEKKVRPLVSVAMPVFNAERYLNSAILSIVRQTYGQLEIIIVDNNSTDGTWSICQYWSELDRRISAFRNESNVGAIANFERSQALCRGKYFLWAAADDLCSDDFIENLVAVLEGDKGCVLVMSNVAKISSSGGFLGGEWLTCSHLGKGASVELPRRLFFANPISNVFFAIYGMYRTSAFHGVNLRGFGILRYATASEIPILAQVALRGRIRCVSRPAKIYRSHSESVFNQEQRCKGILRKVDNFVNVGQCLAHVICFKAKASERLSLVVYLLFSVFCYLAEWPLRKVGLVSPSHTTVDGQGRWIRVR